MLHLRAALLLVTALLHGCALFPPSVTALRAENHKSDRLCVDVPYAETVDRVGNYLRSCYKPRTARSAAFLPNNVVVPVKSDVLWRIEEASLGQRTQFNVALQHGYAASIDIQPSSESCRTEIQVFVMNSFWEKLFDRVRRAATSEPADCTS